MQGSAVGTGNSATQLNLTNFNIVEDGANITLNMGGYTGEALIEGSAIKLVSESGSYSPGKRIRFSAINADGSKYELADGLEWDWSTFTRDGVMRVRKQIPEPTTSTLSLLGLSVLVMRRKRSQI